MEIRQIAPWGGRRANAGRRARGPIASEPHRARPNVSRAFPIHVVARVVPAAHELTRREAYRAIRRALALSFARSDFRIVGLAIHARRVELVVEADDRIALARGMQGFQVAAAKHINRGLGRRGAVFPDRYRPRALFTRAALRRALAGGPFARAACAGTWLLVQSSDLGGGGGGASDSSGIRYSSSSQRPRSAH